MIILSLLVYFIVYNNGGTTSAWAQLNFIIIIISAFFFKIHGALITATVLGIIMGPYMPQDTAHHLMQTPQNWIFRIIIYFSVGFIVSFYLNKSNKYEEIKKDNFLKNHTNGLYNSNKLFLDLKNLNETNTKYQLVCIKIINLEEISKYYDFNIINVISKYIVKIINEINNINTIYSISASEFIVTINDNNITNTMNNFNSFLNKFVQSIKVEDYNFKLILKIGLLQDDKQNHFNAIDIFNKVRIATDQGSPYEPGIFIYDKNFATNRKLYNDIACSLLNDIKKDKLYLVYQPIVDLRTKEINDCEVLVRWNRENKQPVGPNIFVKVAEDIGIIQELTKWVSVHALNNCDKWIAKGCVVKHSINITAGELLDDELRDWAYNLFNNHKTDFDCIGLELTERVLSKDNIKLKQVLNDLQKRGFIIEIDDFGTGYNSLMFLEEIPTDVIKIDKYFIDKIYNKEMQIIIKKIISAIQKTGGTVVAEGVETKEQYYILKELGCDKIQGYLFSKPLETNDFLDYYNKFNISNYI
ncbi:MAG: EAL domain-containing protein [Pleomorphochaeta sp.]